jgi:hypothetical protein
MNVVKNSLSRKNLGQTQRRRDCWHIRLVRLWKAWQATVGALWSLLCWAKADEMRIGLKGWLWNWEWILETLGKEAGRILWLTRHRWWEERDPNGSRALSLAYIFSEGRKNNFKSRNDKLITHSLPEPLVTLIVWIYILCSVYWLNNKNVAQIIMNWLFQP